MFARTRALGVAFAITLVAGLALAQQSTVGGSSSRPRYQQVTIAGALEPNLVQCSTGAASTNRCWLYRLDTNGDFRLVLANDAAAGVTNAINIDRTGTTVDSITLQATTVQVSGQLQISGTSAVKMRLVAADAVGDNYAQYVRADNSTEMGRVGFRDAGDDDLDVLNQISGGNISLATTGAGAVLVNGVAIPRFAYGFLNGSAGGCPVSASFQSRAISCARTGVGAYTVTFSAGYTSLPAICTVSTNSSTTFAQYDASTLTTGFVQVRVSSTGAVAEGGVYISCVGT